MRAFIAAKMSRFISLYTPRQELLCFLPRPRAFIRDPVLSPRSKTAASTADHPIDRLSALHLGRTAAQQTYQGTSPKTCPNHAIAATNPFCPPAGSHGPAIGYGG